MATYIPGVKDYIPKLEPFTPNYKFLQDVLQTRQDRYTNNFKALNNLYNQVVNADLSIEANRQTRDQYANNLSEKLKQVSGKDLSLAQNVEQAKALFKPFYEDDQILYDMGFTSSVKKQMQKAEKLKHSDDPKTREKYWTKGMQRLQWHLEDFSKLSPEQSMSMPIPHYVPYINVVDAGIEKLKEWTGNKDISHWEMTDQGLEITTTNGTAITSAIVGYERDKKGKLKMQNGKPIPITKNIAADYLNQTLLDDPRVQDMYATSAYVDGRTFWSNPQNAQMYGSEENAKKWWLQNEVKKSVDQQIQAIVAMDSQQKDLEGDAASWKKYMQKTGIVPGTAEYKYYQGILDQLELLEKTKRSMTNRVQDLKSPAEDIAQLESLAYKAIAMQNISSDITSASQRYADIGKKTEVKFNEREKILLQHQLKLDAQSHKAWLDYELAKSKGELKGQGEGENWDPFAGPQVDPFDFPEIDWENVDPNSSDAKALDHYMWDQRQNQGIADLSLQKAEYMVDAIVNMYNNPATGLANKLNKSGIDGEITYKNQPSITGNINELYGDVINVPNLEEQMISTDLETFKSNILKPENLDWIAATYNDAIQDTILYEPVEMMIDNKPVTSYVWKNQNSAEDVQFNSEMIDLQFKVEGTESLLQIGMSEINQTKLDLANISGDKFSKLDGKIPLTMYEDEYQLLLDPNAKISWKSILEKRIKDEEGGIDFSNREIKTLDEDEYKKLWVNYYYGAAEKLQKAANIANSGKITQAEFNALGDDTWHGGLFTNKPEAAKKYIKEKYGVDNIDWDKYPYWGVQTPDYVLPPTGGGYDFPEPVKLGDDSGGKVVFDYNKAESDAEKMYEEFRFAQNRLAMDPASAYKQGLPTFDIHSLIAGTPQAGSGAMSGFKYSFHFDKWQLKEGDPNAKNAVEQIQTLRKLVSSPDANFIVKIGNEKFAFGDDEDFSSDEDALSVVELWNRSLAYNPKTASDAKNPVFDIKYIPQGAGGKEAKGEYAAYELSWPKSAAANLFTKGEDRKAQDVAGNIPQDSDFWKTNSVMIFVKRDMDNNPLKTENQARNYMDAIIEHKGNYTATIPNGGEITYYKGANDETMMHLKTWQFDNESGNVVLANDYTKNAGVSVNQLDQHFSLYLQELQRIANQTISDKNKYKRGGQVPNSAQGLQYKMQQKAVQEAQR